MNDVILQGFSITYETLTPILDHRDYTLSIGTIELYIPQYLPLDFSATVGNGEPQLDGNTLLHATVGGLEPDTFQKEYEELGITVDCLTYNFFVERMKNLVITEVYTEFTQNMTELPTPLTIKNIEMIFSNGATLDCTEHLSISVYEQLSLVA